jgi:hypothetical protein
MLRPMKIGQWDGIGRARAVIVHQLGDLGAMEYASHVQVNVDSGRQRILVACDIGLLDYGWSPTSTEPDATWSLRGSLVRWKSVRGLRLQSDAQFDPVTEEVKAIWRLVAEEPKIELAATAEEQGDRGVAALLDFGRACLERAG